MSAWLSSPVQIEPALDAESPGEVRNGTVFSVVGQSGLRRSAGDHEFRARHLGQGPQGLRRGLARGPDHEQAGPLAPLGGRPRGREPDRIHTGRHDPDRRLRQAQAADLASLIGGVRQDGGHTPGDRGLKLGPGGRARGRGPGTARLAGERMERGYDRDREPARGGQRGHAAGPEVGVDHVGGTAVPAVSEVTSYVANVGKRRGLGELAARHLAGERLDRHGPGGPGRRGGVCLDIDRDLLPMACQRGREREHPGGRVAWVAVGGSRQRAKVVGD